MPPQATRLIRNYVTSHRTAQAGAGPGEAIARISEVVDWEAGGRTEARHLERVFAKEKEDGERRVLAVMRRGDRVRVCVACLLPTMARRRNNGITHEQLGCTGALMLAPVNYQLRCPDASLLLLLSRYHR